MSNHVLEKDIYLHNTEAFSKNIVYGNNVEYEKLLDLIVLQIDTKGMTEKTGYELLRILLTQYLKDGYTCDLDTKIEYLEIFYRKKYLLIHRFFYKAMEYFSALNKMDTLIPKRGKFRHIYDKYKSLEKFCEEGEKEIRILSHKYVFSNRSFCHIIIKPDSCPSFDTYEFGEEIKRRILAMIKYFGLNLIVGLGTKIIDDMEYDNFTYDEKVNYFNHVYEILSDYFISLDASSKTFLERHNDIQEFLQNDYSSFPEPSKEIDDPFQNIASYLLNFIKTEEIVMGIKVSGNEEKEKTSSRKKVKSNKNKLDIIFPKTNKTKKSKRSKGNLLIKTNNLSNLIIDDHYTHDV